MSAVLVAALAAAVALLLVQSPSTSLARLAPAATPVGGSLLHGKAGAPSLRHRAWLGAAAGALVLVVLPNPLGLLAAAGTGFAIAIGSGWLWPTPSPDAAAGRELPEVLDLLSVCLAAGAPMSRAVAVVASVSPPSSRAILERVLAHLGVGREATEAWLELREHPDWGPVARDVARSARSGTALTDVLRSHAVESRRRRATSATKAARAVGVKAVVPLMVCFLPAFVLVGVVPIIAGLLGAFFD